MRVSQISLEDNGVVAFNIQRRNRNFTKMLCFIFIRLFTCCSTKPHLCFPSLSYVVCTFPAMICSLNDKTNFFFDSASLPEWCFLTFFVLVVVPFATNPLIYVASNQNYRRYAFKSLKSMKQG